MTKYKSTFEALTQLSESARSALIPFTENLESLSRTIEAFNTSGLLQVVLSFDEQKLTEVGRLAELVSNVNYPTGFADSINDLGIKLNTGQLQEKIDRFQSLFENMGVGNVQALVREQELASNFHRAKIVEDVENLNIALSASINFSIQETIKSRFENLTGFEVKEDFINNTIEQLDLIEQISDIESTKYQLPDEDILAEDEQIEYSGQTYDVDEINNKIQQELKDIHSSKSHTVVINNFHLHISEKDKEPLVKRILIKAFEDFLVRIVMKILLACFLLFTVLVLPGLQESVDSILEDANTREKSVVEKKIKRNIQNGPIDSQFIKDYRYVTADILSVRAKPRKDSLKVGELRYMQVVRIIDRKKRWVLIEYRQDGDEVLLKGWTNLIYLKRFSNK